MEFAKHKIPYHREKLFKIEYKGTPPKHKYAADFIVFDEVVLEVKATSFLVDNFLVQTINYLKASGLQRGIIANFGQRSLVYKRVVF